MPGLMVDESPRRRWRALRHGLPQDGGLVSPIDLLPGQRERPDPAHPLDGFLVVDVEEMEASPADHPLLDGWRGVGVVA